MNRAIPKMKRKIRCYFFKKLRGAGDAKIAQIDVVKRDDLLSIDIEKLEQRLFAGWEVLAKDKERNCLIVKVPLGKE